MEAAASSVSDSSETIADIALPAPVGVVGEAAPDAEAEPGLFDAPQVSGNPVGGVHQFAPPSPSQLSAASAAGPSGSVPLAPPVPLAPTTGGSGSGSGSDRRLPRLAVIGVAAASIAAVAGVAFFALSGDGNEVAGGDESTLVDAGTSEDAGSDGDETTASTAAADGSSGNGGRDGDGASGQGTLTPTSVADDGSDDNSSDPTTATTDAAGGTTTEGPAGPTTSATSDTEPSTTATTAGSTTTSMPSTTATTKVTTTTKATTTTSTTVTEPSVTIGPVDVPIQIVSGPTVNSTGQDKFHFNYTTNDVCGTGSFSVYKLSGGALVGSYAGDGICYGPTHGGFPQASHPTFGGFNLEPGTTYRVVVTVEGTASDGARAAGSGSDSRSFQVTTDA